MTRPGAPKSTLLPVGALLQGSSRLAAKKGVIDSDQWRRIVGERVSERTRPGSLRDGVLTVYVASSVWAQELTLLAPAILERLKTSSAPARELKFRIGDVGERRSEKPKEVAPAEPPMAALPPELARRLENVGDAKLRAAIAEAAAYSLGRNEAATSARRAPRAPRSGASRTAPQDRGPTPPPAAPKGTGGRRSR